MQPEELRALQSPLKEKYKQDPESALITLKATGNVTQGISCQVETGKTIREAGLHPGTGGTELLVCSGDMLLEALVACAGVTLRAVATGIGVDLQEARITAEGDLDFRGTLGVSKEIPVGFKSIRLNFDLEGTMNEEQLSSLAKLTERYCVVYQTLASGTSIDTHYKAPDPS